MRIPQATYRIQFNPDFGFPDVRKIVNYLKDLGISDLYASPVFRSRQGSTHGYDLVDPCMLDPELGSEEQFMGLSQMLRKEEMGWLQDIVPNHMAYDVENSYLADILENGPASPYYRFFDIDWDHYYDIIRGKVLAPFLGNYYGQELENGTIRLTYSESGFFVSYHSLVFPLRIETYLEVLNEAVVAAWRDLGDSHPDYIQLLGILYMLKTLQHGPGDGERLNQVRFIKQNLWILFQKNPAIRTAFNAVIDAYNGEKGKPESFNRLESLLGEQYFRLAFWKVASEEINYRRFFSINDLISLQTERAEVFAHTHTLLLRLVREGHFSGLRVDHVDGLYDPAAYLQQLRNEAPETYLVVEKILGKNESLPDWPVQGTTGYDFLNALNAVFCEPSSDKIFTDLYQKFTGQRQSCAALLSASKKLIIERYLFGDVNNLAHLLKAIANRHRYGSDITMDSLKRALIEILAEFPVYRSYLDSKGIRESDRCFIESALARAKDRNPGHFNELDYIGKVLLGQVESFLPGEDRVQWLHFAMRFQQLSGPLMAKGLEDTLLYVYNRLLSLNDVGGDPSRFGITIEDFHTFNQKRCQKWSNTLNATATHDTKRGEDVRARLNILTEIPREWAQQVRLWSRLNRGQKKTLNRAKVPDKNDEYFLYQTLVGAWPVSDQEIPDFVRRLKKYLVKAVREAKTHTTWLKPDNDYEDAFLEFVDKIIGVRCDTAFMEEFKVFQKKVAHFGRLASLSQTLIKITAPGIPDFYQGSEFWDLNLVDPDNRRPVDFTCRQNALHEIRSREIVDRSGLIRGLLQNMENGRVKLFLIQRALALRNQQSLLFREGGYLPLEIIGSYQKHLVAFARRYQKDIVITLAPRFLAGWLTDGTHPIGHDVWQDTVLVLPEGCNADWQEFFTEKTLSGNTRLKIGAILSQFPVGLLVGRG